MTYSNKKLKLIKSGQFVILFFGEIFIVKTFIYKLYSLFLYEWWKTLYFYDPVVEIFFLNII